MAEPISLEDFYQLLRRRRNADEWRLGGGQHGSRAAKALLPFTRTKNGSLRIPRKGEGQRYTHYQERRERIKKVHGVLESFFGLR